MEQAPPVPERLLSKRPKMLAGVLAGTLVLLSSAPDAIATHSPAEQFLQMCKAALEQPDVNAAIENCLKAIETNPMLVDAYLVLGRLWVNIEEYGPAVSLLLRARSLFPENPYVRVWLAAGLFYSDRCKENVTEGQDAIGRVRLPPEERATILYFVGSCLHALGHYEFATRSLEEAAAVSFDVRPTLFERNDLARFIDQALILAYWRYLAVSPGDQEARLRLVRVLLRRDDVLGPLRELEVIVAARPNWAEPYYWLGVVHLRLARASRNSELIRSHFAAARRVLETYIRLDASGPYTEDAKYLLLQIPRI